MSFFLWLLCLTTMGLLGYYLYTVIDWDWLNPHVFTKGLVFGKAMRREERIQAGIDAASAKFQREVDAKIEADIEAAAKRIKHEAFTEARLKKLRDDINTPAPVKKAALFAGSKVTKVNKPAKVIHSQSTIIGTVEVGVGPAPANYPSKVDTRRPGSKIKQLLKGISG